MSLKQRVYVKKPRTIQHLKDSTREEMWNIKHDTLREATENILLRTKQWVATGGGHLNDIFVNL
jgi:hypothetical protein